MNTAAAAPAARRSASRAAVSPKVRILFLLHSPFQFCHAHTFVYYITK